MFQNEGNIDDTVFEQELPAAEGAEVLREQQGTKILPTQDKNSPRETEKVESQRETALKKKAQVLVKNPVPKKKALTEINAPDDSVTKALQ